ncbi:hypothetical protein JMUB7556_28310 [Staphylococcus aureus]
MSRGLGDVYKRQILTSSNSWGQSKTMEYLAVSYTHLTLPTN